MIILDNVTKFYTMGEEEVHALDGVSLHIKKGEFVAIIGPSGSGKSTLMNIIGCLDDMTSGSYTLEGLPIENYTENQLARIRNEKIGFIFQGFNLLSKLNALENVELPLIYSGVSSSDRHELCMKALTMVQLEKRSKHKPTQLSGGQQQRVAIARALVNSPSLILADEPTGNLDSKTGREIMNIFHRLNDEGHTIILITHDEKVAQQAKRIIHIMDGKIAEDES